MREWHARKKGHVGKMGGRVGWCQQPLGCRMAFIKQKQQKKKMEKTFTCLHLSNWRVKLQCGAWSDEGISLGEGGADTCWCWREYLLVFFEKFLCVLQEVQWAVSVATHALRARDRGGGGKSEGGREQERGVLFGICWWFDPLQRQRRLIWGKWSHAGRVRSFLAHSFSSRTRFCLLW